MVGEPSGEPGASQGLQTGVVKLETAWDLETAGELGLVRRMEEVSLGRDVFKFKMQFFKEVVISSPTGGLGERCRVALPSQSEGKSEKGGEGWKTDSLSANGRGAETKEVFFGL